MTDITAMVDELIAAGCPAALAARVVTASYLAGVQSMADRENSGGIPVDAVAEKRRAYDRERKRKSGGIPPESTGTPRNSENAYLSKEDKKEENKKELEAPENQFHRKATRGHRLPDDWQPTPPDRAIGIELLGEPLLATEIEKFRDYWRAQPGSKGVKLDWDATFRNWIRNARRPHGQPAFHNRANQAAGSSPAGSDPIVAGMARALERRREARAAADPGREHIRGGADAAGLDDAEPGAASGDRPAHRQLAFLPPAKAN